MARTAEAPPPEQAEPQPVVPPLRASAGTMRGRACVFIDWDFPSWYGSVKKTLPYQVAVGDPADDTDGGTTNGLARRAWQLLKLFLETQERHLKAARENERLREQLAEARGQVERLEQQVAGYKSRQKNHQKGE